jgi:hypothetical protein
MFPVHFPVFLVHGSVPEGFVKCTAVPIPEKKNVNLTDSSNYRGIS